MGKLYYMGLEPYEGPISLNKHFKEILCLKSRNNHQSISEKE